MFNITRQLGKIRSGQNRLQSRIANLNDQYKYSILSGEGSPSKLRDLLSRQMLALGYRRQDESYYVQEQNETKKLFKDLLGLSSLSVA